MDESQINKAIDVREMKLAREQPREHIKLDDEPPTHK